MSAIETSVDSTVKQLMRLIIEDQPVDATYDEILRKLAFERMVNRGLADAAQGRTVDTEALRTLIRSWTE